MIFVKLEHFISFFVFVVCGFFNCSFLIFVFRRHHLCTAFVGIRLKLSKCLMFTDVVYQVIVEMFCKLVIRSCLHSVWVTPRKMRFGSFPKIQVRIKTDCYC